MLARPPKLGLFRWLQRELSTDDEDMIAFVAGFPDSDDDDAQALLEELAALQIEATRVRRASFAPPSTAI